MEINSPTKTETMGTKMWCQSLKWYPKTQLQNRCHWINGSLEDLQIIRLRLGNVGRREGKDIHCILCDKRQLTDPVYHRLTECDGTKLLLKETTKVTKEKGKDLWISKYTLWPAIGHHRQELCCMIKVIQQR